MGNSVDRVLLLWFNVVLQASTSSAIGLLNGQNQRRERTSVAQGIS